MREVHGQSRVAKVKPSFAFVWVGMSKKMLVCKGLQALGKQDLN